MAVFIRHTFRSEMSYLDRESKSICHLWCHHLSWKVCRPAATLPTCRFSLGYLFIFLQTLPLKLSRAQSSPVSLFCPRSGNLRKRKSCPFVVSFWRRLGVGDGARSNGAASRFQPCLDCHIVWPCMSECTESSACPVTHHAPDNLPKNLPEKCAKRCRKWASKTFPQFLQNFDVVSRDNTTKRLRNHIQKSSMLRLK